MSGFEILEHTADVGVLAVGPSLETCFANATHGLVEIMGIGAPGGGEDVAIDVSAEDLGALLVEWLDEVIYLHETRDAGVAAVRVDRVTERRATGSVRLTRRAVGAADGTQVKAVTFHQLLVEETAAGWRAQVYFDV